MGISVILPTYNRPEILGQCLVGFTRQTLPADRFEIVIVDDGSSPPVENILSQFRNSLSIKYQYQENGGPSIARNAAILMAGFDLLALHDDDDIPAPDYLERCVAFHSRYTQEEDILLTQVAPDPALPQSFLLKWMFAPDSAFISFPDPDKVHDFWKFFSGASSCKKSIFRFGLYDPSYRCFEDMEVAIRINSKKTLRVRYDPMAVSYFVREPDFGGLVRRTYREGRAQWRFFQIHKDNSYGGVTPTINDSEQIFASLSPVVPQIFSTIARLHSYGEHIPDDFFLNLGDQKFCAENALYACYSIATLYARARGWIEQKSGVEELYGCNALDQLFSEHYKLIS